MLGLEWIAGAGNRRESTHCGRLSRLASGGSRGARGLGGEGVRLGGMSRHLHLMCQPCTLRMVFAMHLA